MDTFRKSKFRHSDASSWVLYFLSTELLASLLYTMQTWLTRVNISFQLTLMIHSRYKELQLLWKYYQYKTVTLVVLFWYYICVSLETQIKKKKIICSHIFFCEHNKILMVELKDTSVNPLFSLVFQGILKFQVE